MRIPLAIMILLPLVSILCDVYIYAGIRRKYGLKNVRTRLYGISAILCWLFLAVLLTLPRRSANDGIEAIMWMLYAYASIYIPKIIYTIFSAIGLIPLLFKCNFWRIGKFIGLPIGIIIFAAMWYGATFGRSQLEVNRVVFESNHLPAAFNGFRIVQFSDAHVGTWGNDTHFVAKMVDSINSMKPDMIVFTGDIVNRKTDEIRPFVNILSRLKAPYGVYSILGNHDYGDYITWDSENDKKRNLEEIVDVQKKMGWKLLNNDRCPIEINSDTLMLIGVENWGEPPFKQYGDLNKAYPYSNDSLFNVNDNKFKILLSHNPEHWNQHVSKETNIDLTLAGHTHAMQFMIKAGDFRWSPAKYIYEQWGGMYSRKNPANKPVSIYVNIGSGEVGMPYRIGATSEITEITLRRK